MDKVFRLENDYTMVFSEVILFMYRLLYDQKFGQSNESTYTIFSKKKSKEP